MTWEIVYTVLFILADNMHTSHCKLVAMTMAVVAMAVVAMAVDGMCILVFT